MGKFLSERKFGYGWILFSVLFLFEPTYAFADILPDLVGYLFLYIGLTALADLNESFSQSRRCFFAAFWISAAQEAAYWLLRRLEETRGSELNPYEIPVLRLTAIFGLLLFRLIILIPAYRNLMRGCCTLAESTDCSREGDWRAEEKTERAVVAAVVLSSLLSLLPELTLLFVAEGSPVDWFSFAGMLRIVCAVLSLAAGVVWLIRWIGYFRDIRKREDLFPVLRERYREKILSDRQILTARAFRPVSVLLLCGTVLTAEIPLSGRSLFPGILSALAFLFAFLLLGQPRRQRFLCVGTSLSLAAVSVVRIVVNENYLASYLPEDAFHLPAAYRAYLPVRWLAVTQILLTLCLAALAFFAFFQKTKKLVGDGSLFRIPSASRPARLITSFAFLCCAAGVNLAYLFLQDRFGWMWWISLSCSAVAAGLFSGALSGVRGELGTGHK